MTIILVKGVIRKGKKMPIGTRMNVTPERFAELGDAAQEYKGPILHVRKKPKTDLFKPKHI